MRTIKVGVLAVAASAMAQPTLTQSIFTTSGGTGDRFGTTIELRDDLLVVGATGVVDIGGGTDGEVRIFERTGGVFSLLQVLHLPVVPPLCACHEMFGEALGISGDLLAAGARVVASDGVPGGAVYTFARSGNMWSVAQEVLPSDRTGPQTFGRVLALDGQTLVSSDMSEVYGSPLADARGAVYTFEDAAGTPIETQRIEPPDLDADAIFTFGDSLALDGDTLVVGASRFEATSQGVPGGAVYVFERGPGGVWALDQRLSASDTSHLERFGAAVAVEDGVLAVGAPEHFVGASTHGAVYIFERDAGGNWVQTGKATNAQSGNLGSSITISQGVVVAGDPAARAGSGEAVVVRRSAGAWVLDREFFEVPTGGGEFGDDVALDGLTIVAGAPSRREFVGAPTSGAALVFDLGCYADCEQDDDLDVFDFLCFQSRFAGMEMYADCEGDGDWDVFDFLCFQSAFAAGCA